MKYNFYVSDMAPNGTRHLIITDEDNQVIETLIEAVFGADHEVLYIEPDDWQLFEYYGESIGPIRMEPGTELYDSYLPCLEGRSCDVIPVWRAQTHSLLRYIAVSPINNGQETAQTIKKYLDLNNA